MSEENINMAPESTTLLRYVLKLLQFTYILHTYVSWHVLPWHENDVNDGQVAMFCMLQKQSSDNTVVIG